MTTGRYFEGEHPALERCLDDHFSRVRESFAAERFRGALVLGGGYGRGEGGVMPGADGPVFSNDLDYFLFDESPDDPRLLAWSRGIEAAESAKLGIDVEIKALRADSIGDPSLSMMFADLVAGHVTVAGNTDFLDRMRPDLDFSRILPEEATRLLWNRGSGMYFSRCRLADRREMPFVIRNHEKLKLALGDAWLCLHGLYSPKCRERAARLADREIPERFNYLRRWHEEGVRFKFQPHSDAPSWELLDDESDELAAAWGDIYLAVESKRLARDFHGFGDYLSARRLMPASPVARNLLLLLRDKIRRGQFLRPPGDYPRTSLMRALPCLLGLTKGGVAEAARFLPAPGGDPKSIRQWEKTYSTWWAYYA